MLRKVRLALLSQGEQQNRSPYQFARHTFFSPAVEVPDYQENQKQDLEQDDFGNNHGVLHPNVALTRNVLRNAVAGFAIRDVFDASS